MRFVLVYFQGQTSKWAELACGEYQRKISAILPFDQTAMRSPSYSRSQASDKREQEGRELLKILKKTSHLILFDQNGREFDSKEFCRFLIQNIASGGQLVLAIGGPYGFSEGVKERAVATMSLSRLTLNHELARVVALEQIFRALTIWRGIPYHNE